jgi:glycosyltransferase involved in cell wall biosynthesis
MQRIVYVSPFDNPGNTYIKLQKMLWQDIGFDVRPFNLSLLLKRSGLQGIFNTNNIIALHWLESRPFLNLKPGRYLQLKGLFAFLAYCLVLSIARARTVQFVHNHHVHDAPGISRRFSARLTRWLGKIVDVRIVHDPASAILYNAIYLPHPLYREMDLLQPRPERNRQSAPLFGTLGAIRPYKGIDRLLKAWPIDETLLIAGGASSATITELNDIIAKRGLRNTITTNFKFLSQSEFNDYLDRIDVLVLPHTAESILVSGAFFEAVGRVPAILARRSSFSAWAQAKIANIYLFDDDQSLSAAIAKIRENWPFENSASTSQRVEELFGWKTCCNHYSQVFNTQ